MADDTDDTEGGAGGPYGGSPETNPNLKPVDSGSSWSPFGIKQGSPIIGDHGAIARKAAADIQTSFASMNPPTAPVQAGPNNAMGQAQQGVQQGLAKLPSLPGLINPGRQS